MSLPLLKMRLILKLKANKTASQKETYSKFFTTMHGFIYGKLQDSKLRDIHNKRSFKGFCFGYLYPVRNESIDEGKGYSIVVSSPLPCLIQELFFRLEEGEIINLGETSFALDAFCVKQFNLSLNSTIETVTIINLTKHEKDKIIALNYNNQDYLEALRKNLIRKYNSFNQDRIEENFPLFENIDISLMKKGKFAVPLLLHNGEKDNKFTVIGNKLRFKFNNISEKQLRILQFCFDAGFGERNTYGMGFMIVRREERR
jgi:CRISPR-associated endoribonuclease Cas6